MRNAKILLFVLAPAVVVASSCTFLPTFTLGTTSGAGGAGGGALATTAASTGTSTPPTSTSTGGTGGAGGGERCGITFPSLPSVPDDGGAITLTAALHTVNLGDAGGAVNLGLDLDQTCSCHGQGASCIEKVQHCDDAAGRDNSTGELFTTLKLALGSMFSSGYFSGEADKGHWSLLYRVKGYNGQKDDSQVELDWYLSTGFDHSETKTSATPLWDGNDVWKVSASSVNGMSLDAPLYSDVHAYVSGGTLVASIPETPIPLPIGGDGHLSFTLSGAGLLGSLYYDEEVQSYRLLNGQVVGRLKLENVFASMSSFRFADGKTLCTDNPLYPIAKNNFCNSADILAEPGTPSKPCDAISFAIGFEADPAKLGAIDATTPMTASPCPASTDPANDSCPP